MKTLFTLLLTVVTITVVNVLTIVENSQRADAAEVYLNVRNADIPSGGAVQTTVLGGYGGKYTVHEFASQNQCEYYHYQLPSEYVAASTISARINFCAVSNNGNLSMQASVACVDSNEVFHAQTLTAGTAATQASGLAHKMVKWTPASSFINSAACSPLDILTLKLCRTDVNAFSVWLRRPDLIF